MWLGKVWQSFSNGLSKRLQFFGAICVGIMALLIGVEVISRYVFHTTHAFMEEINPFLQVWITFLLAGVLLKDDQNIDVSILRERLKGKAGAYLRLIIALFTAAGAAFLMIAGWQGTVFMWTRRGAFITEIPIPGWLIVFPLFIGMVFVSMWNVEKIIKSVIEIIRSPRKSS